MNNTEIRTKIKDYSSQIERNFMLLSDKFPTLLNKQGGTSLEELRDVLTKIGEGNTASNSKEKDLFSGYSNKYNSLFEQLNQRIQDLEEVNSHVKDIKSDSEEMELIALNAMVISIKSGEKGRAFSAITENLKRLSTDMILYSNNLISEEKRLLESITSVKQIFGGIVDSQKQLSALGDKGSSGIQDLLSNAASPLEEMRSAVASVYKPIQTAMEGIQHQDIIRQALDHVQLYMDQIIDDTYSDDGTDKDLDTVTFNITVLQLCQKIISNIESSLSRCTGIFRDNWSSVSTILDSVEHQRTSYINRFLSDSMSGADNILSWLNLIMEQFQQMISEFAHYQLVQKDLSRTCQNINEEARTMYAVFENLGPVVNRLHHVRILQQIEVAKNVAISDVRDSVTDMEKLIQSANGSLDSMRALIGSFIEQIGSLLSSFMESITADNTKMEELPVSKNTFFNSLKDAQARLSGCMANFTVFPDGFSKECQEVGNALQAITAIDGKFSSLNSEVKSRIDTLSRKRVEMFAKRQISSWTIKDSHLNELLSNFRSSAGQDSSNQYGSSAIPGDVTLF
ncbi:MAG: hypothetical protein II811_08555 [Spirochaetaceae bacterium]|nr:hypothetical protein [Spirochaetaceae bacterium]